LATGPAPAALSRRTPRPGPAHPTTAAPVTSWLLRLSLERRPPLRRLVLAPAARPLQDDQPVLGAAGRGEEEQQERPRPVGAGLEDQPARPAVAVHLQVDRPVIAA